MNWNTFYDRFYDWEERTQLRHMSSLTSFGPSSEICELACAFFEQKSADRLIKRALAAGISFTAEEVLELDGVVDNSLMPQLIRTIYPITPEELDDLAVWLNEEELQALAIKNHIRVDEYGFVVLPEMAEIEKELEREEAFAEEELEHMQAEQAAREAEDILLAKVIIAVRQMHRRERRKKNRDKQ